MCHFTQRKKKSHSLPNPNPNPNCKHQALTIWLRATADDCSALHRLSRVDQHYNTILYNVKQQHYMT